jgi:hypothetical protein
MSPKEKAQELFNKYFAVAESIEWTNKETSAKAEIMNDELGPDVLIYWHELAKKSAVIAVDEILLLITLITYQPTIDYWQEVKHEIEEL